MKSERERIIALAAVFQAAGLAAQIARSGMADSAAMESSVYSLFQTHPDSVEAVFNGISGISTGAQLILNQIKYKSSQTHDMDITRYVMTLLHLERKLAKKPAMLDTIGAGIQRAAERLEHFPMLHGNILAQLAELYAETISTLQPRIMIHGEPLHLQNPENVNKIRTLLLAGIRSAMLWQQCGGSRLQILFGRRRLEANAQKLVHEIRTKELQ